MFRGFRPLVMLASFAITLAMARGADWGDPRPVLIASQSGQHGFKVLPKSFEAATGVLFSVDSDGKDQVIWKSSLVNVPHQVFVSNDGKRVVTVDTYAALGQKHSLVVYDDKGKVLVDYKLEDLVSEEDIRDRILSKGSSRSWAAAATCKFVGGASESFEIATHWGAVITVNLTSGAVTKSGLTLTLVLSDELYDTVVPGKSSLKCVIRNDTPRSIRIPLGYEVDTVRLESGRMSLVGSIERDDGKSGVNKRNLLTMADVSPRETKVLFELPLDDLLAKGVVSRADKNRKWHWDWQIRNAAPLSPIHKPHHEELKGYIEQASFQVKVKYGLFELVSNKVALKVKQPPLEK